MKRIVVTSVLKQNSGNAGSKAKNDDRNILVRDGFDPLDFTVPKNKVKKIAFSKYSVQKIIKNNVADEYILQYPMYSMIIIKNIIRNIRRVNRSAKIVILIHDIEALRQRKDDQSYANKEIQILNKANAIIVHNTSMKNYLQNSGVRVPMVEQNLFDYLNDVPIRDKGSCSLHPRNICFAGNLKKADFLNKLSFNRLRLNVYGTPRPSKIYKEGIFYRGSFNPDELPQYLEGDFGLVWDGSSTRTNTGIFGEYTRFNSPHKTSLYLSTGIPVIVWSEAAIASFIQTNKLGIVVDRIDNLDDILTSVSLEEYKEIKNNVYNYSHRIRSGKNLLEAIKNIENIIM